MNALKAAIASAASIVLLNALPAFAVDASILPKQVLSERPAVVSPGSLKTGMLAASLAGKRLVAVGDRGVVLLSDDDGATFHQAHSVPTRATLTAVFFLPDGKTGWAVGHWGVILTTTDAGETWTLQRDDVNVDQPLFSVAFTSAQEGVAVGLWSLLLRTRDGGKTWQSGQIAPAAAGQTPASDAAGAAPGGAGGAGSGKNLFSIFVSDKGTLLIAAEQGTVYRSTDAGATWTSIDTGNKGTFWAGIRLKSGALIVAGLSGKIYRSVDDGETWKGVTPVTKSSITALTQAPDGRIFAVGLEGAMLMSADDGATFTASDRPDRLPLSAVIVGSHNAPLILTPQGPLPLAVSAK
jgi:photosystem II stability/assembly factor-like uncharacterized protein